MRTRKGHIKTIFNSLFKLFAVPLIPNLGEFYRIAGAIINRFHILIRSANAAFPADLLERANEPNVNLAIVATENDQNR